MYKISNKASSSARVDVTSRPTIPVVATPKGDPLSMATKRRKGCRRACGHLPLDLVLWCPPQNSTTVAPPLPAARAACRHVGQCFRLVLHDKEGTQTATVAYLLNIWILGPVAPLTGQYSRGGLN